MKKLVPITILLFAIAALVAVFFDELFTGADYRAYCKMESECNGGTVEECISKYDELRAEQGPCKKFQDRIVACKLAPGGAACEHAAAMGMQRLMPQDPCVPAIDELMECLAERDEGEAPKPQPVEAAP